MVRASRSALALGIVVLAAASSTAAGASGSPVVEAGGARPVPDPRWLARASTYDTACSAPDADPAEYVQCIAMHVDDSVSAPAQATDATCVLASLVTDDALGLANCRFVAQHLGRTAFDAGVAASPAEAETAARETFRACHASFCDGGCAQGVLVGMLVRAAGEGAGSSPGGDETALAATAAGAFRACAATPGATASVADTSVADASVADAASPATCAAGIGQGLFAASKSLSASVSLCHAAAIEIAAERAAADPSLDQMAAETRLRRACISGALLRNALAKVTKLALDANATASSETSETGSGTVSKAGEDDGSAAARVREGLDAVCAAFAETSADASASASSSAGASAPEDALLRELNPALCGAALGRAMAMITAPSFTDDDAEAARRVDADGGVAERLCGLVTDTAVAAACAEAALAAAAARETPGGAAFSFCEARGDAAEATTGGREPDAAATAGVVERAEETGGALGFGDWIPARTNATNATNATNETNETNADPDPDPAGCDAFSLRTGSQTEASFDFGFAGCALAAEGAGFRVAAARGGAPEVASLPFCGEAVAYPIAAGNAAHHRAEDDGIKDVHARATEALFTSFADATDAEKEACASALKTEMCRTAFSACDVNANDAELEYCAHAHVPSFGAAASVVGVCTRPEPSPAGAERLGGERTEPAEMGARVVCGARWNGVACFSLPAECGAARDTPEGTCPADAEAWRGMSGGCFYVSKEKEKGGKDEGSGAFAEFVAVPQDALAPRAPLATPESADACVASGGASGATVATVTTTAKKTSDLEVSTEVSTAPRNATTTARETIAIVKEQAAEAFGASGAENRTKNDPRRAFTRSDRETGGALWILCAQALVAGSLVAAAWTCTRGWLEGENGNPITRWGARRAPNGGPAFFRLKPTRDVADAELADLPAATKGSTLATLPKRGAAKGSPEKQGARRVAEAPF